MDINFLAEKVTIKKSIVKRVVFQFGDLYDGKSSTWRQMGKITIPAYGTYSNTAWCSFLKKRFVLGTAGSNIDFLFDATNLNLGNLLITGASGGFGSIQFTIECDDSKFAEIMQKVEAVLPLTKEGDGVIGAVIKHYHHYWIFGA